MVEERKQGYRELAGRAAMQRQTQLEEQREEHRSRENEAQMLAHGAAVLALFMRDEYKPVHDYLVHLLTLAHDGLTSVDNTPAQDAYLRGRVSILVELLQLEAGHNVPINQLVNLLTRNR